MMEKRCKAAVKLKAAETSQNDMQKEEEKNIEKPLYLTRYE